MLNGIKPLLKKQKELFGGLCFGILDGGSHSTECCELWHLLSWKVI